MQELRSTEILDKEIRSEARRKAEAVLTRADEECKRILDGVDNKIEAARQEKQVFYDKKFAAFVKDIEASSPLEKQRFEVSYVQTQLMKAVNEYLAALSQEKRIELVLNYCKIPENEFKAFVYGFDTELVTKILGAKTQIKLLSVEKTEFGKIVLEDDIGLEKNEGIILETKDKAVRCRLSLTEVFTRILDKYRKELTTALFESEKTEGTEGGEK